MQASTNLFLCDYDTYNYVRNNLKRLLNVKDIMKDVWFRTRNSSVEKKSNSFHIKAVYVSCLFLLV